MRMASTGMSSEGMSSEGMTVTLAIDARSGTPAHSALDRTTRGPYLEGARDRGSGQSAPGRLKGATPVIRKRCLSLDGAGESPSPTAEPAMTMESLLSAIAAALAGDTARVVREQGAPHQKPAILVRARDARGVTYFFGRVDASGRRALSRQEMEVARQLALDRSVKQIVRDLGISEGTVKTYKQRIQQKTGLRGRAALALYAFHLYSPCAHGGESRPKISDQDLRPRSQTKISDQANQALRREGGILRDADVGGERSPVMLANLQAAPRGSARRSGGWPAAAGCVNGPAEWPLPAPGGMCLSVSGASRSPSGGPGLGAPRAPPPR
jgi:DNA-binding CsgD family transcriptional regulator